MAEAHTYAPLSDCLRGWELVMEIYNAGNRVMNTYIYRALQGYIMIDTGYEHSLKRVEKRANL